MLRLNYLFIFHFSFFVFVVIAVVFFFSHLSLLQRSIWFKKSEQWLCAKVWVKCLALLITFTRKPEMRHVA